MDTEKFYKATARLSLALYEGWVLRVAFAAILIAEALVAQVIGGLAVPMMMLLAFSTGTLYGLMIMFGAYIGFELEDGNITEEDLH